MADFADEILVFDRLQEREVAPSEFRKGTQLREYDHCSISFLLAASVIRPRMDDKLYCISI
jgi:hypothetical protein